MERGTIQIFGDLSLEGAYCDPSIHEDLALNMKELSDWLPDSDLRLVNWESPVWGDGAVNHLKNPRLTTTPEALNSIKPLGLTMASLANNHFYDCKEEGFTKTVECLNNIGISTLGASVTNYEISLDGEICNQKYSIIACVSSETNPNVPPDCKISYNSLDIESLKKTIIERKNEGHKIVLYLHWGEEELTRIPSPEQRKVAKKLIEYGADVIVGSHVHCIQGMEKWKEGIIFYSLGNFLFNTNLIISGVVDSFRTKDTFETLILHLNLNDHEITYETYFLSRPRNSLLYDVKSDPGVTRKFKLRSSMLRLPDFIYPYFYKLECIYTPIRAFIDKKEGLFKAIFSIRFKQISLFFQQVLKYK